MKRTKALICLAAVLLPAACSAAHDSAPSDSAPSAGTITGRLVLEGGPLGPNGQQPGIRPIGGTVRFTGGQFGSVTVRTTSSGVFSVQLPVGRYQVSDRSPSVQLASAGGTSSQEWSTPVWVTVTAHHTSAITLTSIVP